MIGNLNEDELEKLRSAREKSKSDLAVQAAEKNKREANTLEERNVTSEDYRRAIREAVVKANPSVASLLAFAGVVDAGLYDSFKE